MITPYLEKLIHEGRAVWKQEVFGIAQAFSFKLPEKSYIIITDFTYANFVEIGGNLADEQGFATWQTILKRSIHQTKFSSIIGDYNYVMRDNIECFQDFFDGYKQWWSNDIQQFDCYQIHTEHLQIQFCVGLMNFNAPAPFANNLRNDDTKFSGPPQGVGTVNNGGFNNISAINDGNFPTKDYVFDDSEPLQYYQNDSSRRLIFPFNTQTQFILYWVPYNEFMRCCPIINMSYVLINEELPVNLKTR